jgi:hypothetical protein
MAPGVQHHGWKRVNAMITDPLSILFWLSALAAPSWAIFVITDEVAAIVAHCLTCHPPDAHA